MAKGEPLSRYQTGIVKRFYHYRDGQLVMKLQELVSELAMDPASDRLWKRAETTLAKVEIDPPLPAGAVAEALGARSVEKLAELVQTLHAR
ncbi:MAG: hypothetical protein AAF235_11940 [Planctomycetota bacterium]